MAYEVDLLYEINEKGERVLVRSLESTQRVFLRLKNCTSRPVNIWWRDYKGTRRHYVRLEPGRSFDINTFVTHPWQFTDAASDHPFLINNKIIYRAPSYNGGRRFRMTLNISLPMRTLREMTLVTIASLLPHPDASNKLDLPSLLKNELQELLVQIDKKTQKRID